VFHGFTWPSVKNTNGKNTEKGRLATIQIIRTLSVHTNNGHPVQRYLTTKRKAHWTGWTQWNILITKYKRNLRSPHIQSNELSITNKKCSDAPGHYVAYLRIGCKWEKRRDSTTRQTLVEIARHTQPISHHTTSNGHTLHYHTKCNPFKNPLSWKQNGFKWSKQ